MYSLSKRKLILHIIHNVPFWFWHNWWQRASEGCIIDSPKILGGRHVRSLMLSVDCPRHTQVPSIRAGTTFVLMQYTLSMVYSSIWNIHDHGPLCPPNVGGRGGRGGTFVRTYISYVRTLFNSERRGYVNLGFLLKRVTKKNMYQGVASPPNVQEPTQFQSLQVESPFSTLSSSRCMKKFSRAVLDRNTLLSSPWAIKFLTTSTPPMHRPSTQKEGKVGHPFSLVFRFSRTSAFSSTLHDAYGIFSCFNIPVNSRLYLQNGFSGVPFIKSTNSSWDLSNHFSVSSVILARICGTVSVCTCVSDFFISSCACTRVGVRVC